MRPAFTLYNAHSATAVLSQAALIASGEMDYHRQSLPVDDSFDRATYIPSSGEAEMDRYRPDRAHSTTHQKSASAAETREQKLARIKAEIDLGVYDTDDKLDIALSRMFASLPNDSTY